MTVILNQKSKSRSLAAAASLLMVLLAGCGSRNAVQAPTTPTGPTGPWFCEPTTDGASWDCTDNPNRIANPRPSQPLARVLAARDAAEAEARRAAAVSLDGPGGSLMTTRPDALAVTPPAPGTAGIPAASGTGRTATEDVVGDSTTIRDDADTDPTPATEAPALEPAYARLAYRPDRPMSLLDLPPEFYAVQVVALSSAAELESFFDRLGVSELTAAEVEVDGDLRYVLLLGIYETFAAAEQAAADPPAALASYYPWVRRLEGLQAAMRRAEQRRLQAGGPG